MKTDAPAVSRLLSLSLSIPNAGSHSVGCRLFLKFRPHESPFSIPSVASSRSSQLPTSCKDTNDMSERKIRSQERFRTTLKSMSRTFIHHMKHHFGIGIVCAVAYFDPGNWSTDLQAGSEFGYKLLFVVLLAGLGAVVLQILSSKLGCVTGLDLASHCRLLLHDHPRYPVLVRYVFLYPLYILSELAIISTDIAELLGSAIGLVLLIPRLPLPIAVLLTALDVIFFLAIGDPSKGNGKRPVRIFEFVIISLVMVVFFCFIVLLARVGPHWPDVFDGYLPSKDLVEPSALYAAVGIIGATVMPHGLFLGSRLATQDRLSFGKADSSSLPTPSSAQRSTVFFSFKKTLKDLFSVRRVRRRGDTDQPDTWTPYGERKNNTIDFVRAHYKHGVWDLVVSLLGFAVVINSAILILSSAVFFYGPGKAADGAPAGLFDAFRLIREYIGSAAAIIFAIALICSGQSASITATLAGQIVSEGFIQWSISPFLRRLVTRLLGLIPSMLVAVIVGRKGIDSLLVISQVILSIVLPFVMFPLIWLTSSSVVMRVPRPRRPIQSDSSAELDMSDDEKRREPSSTSEEEAVDNEEYAGAIILESGDVESVEDEEPKTQTKMGKVKARADKAYTNIIATPLKVGDETTEFVDYSNGWPLTILSYAIWVVILIANGYLIVTFAIG